MFFIFNTIQIYMGHSMKIGFQSVTLDLTECSVIIKKKAYIRCGFQSRKALNVMGVTAHQIELLIGYNLNCPLNTGPIL